ncbi:Na+/proline symporter [Bradyrhizobium sp. USDA 4469]
MNGALPFIAAAALLALALGFLARRGKNMNLEEWTVGGRGFGAIFVFLLLAGEIYTTFTFLGGSGYAYGKGAPAYYILAYGTLAYVLSYFMLPPIWRYAKEHRLYSQSDFFVRKYDSPTLGVIVAIVDIVALIPYLVLQFKGLGIIVEVAGYGAISSTVAIWTGAIVVAAYVMVSGVHGSAWTAVAKDLLILVVVIFLGIYLPHHYYGGLASMFSAIEQAKPGFAVLPPHGESLWWFSSTVLLTALGFYMWAAQLRLDLYGEERQGHSQERDRAAAISAHPVVRVLRRLRSDPSGSGAHWPEHRFGAVQALGEDIRPLVCRGDRCDRCAHCAGTWIDDPDDCSDLDRQQSLPRPRPVG